LWVAFEAAMELEAVPRTTAIAMRILVNIGGLLSSVEPGWLSHTPSVRRHEAMVTHQILREWAPTRRRSFPESHRMNRSQYYRIRSRQGGFYSDQLLKQCRFGISVWTSITRGSCRPSLSGTYPTHASRKTCERPHRRYQCALLFLP